MILSMRDIAVDDGNGVDIEQCLGDSRLRSWSVWYSVCGAKIFNRSAWTCSGLSGTVLPLVWCL